MDRLGVSAFGCRSATSMPAFFMAPTLAGLRRSAGSGAVERRLQPLAGLLGDRPVRRAGSAAAPRPPGAVADRPVNVACPVATRWNGLFLLWVKCDGP